MPQPISSCADQQQAERLQTLYKMARERGVTMSQWNLVGVDKDLPDVVSEIIDLLEKTEAGQVEDADLSLF